MDIKNAQVLVTGGSRGIGAALAHEYSAKGARVIVTARSGEDLERVATEINGVAHVADLSTAETVDNLIQEIESALEQGENTRAAGRGEKLDKLFK